MGGVWWWDGWWELVHFTHGRIIFAWRAALASWLSMNSRPLNFRPIKTAAPGYLHQIPTTPPPRSFTLTLALIQITNYPHPQGMKGVEARVSVSASVRVLTWFPRVRMQAEEEEEEEIDNQDGGLQGGPDKDSRARPHASGRSARAGSPACSRPMTSSRARRWSSSPSPAPSPPSAAPSTSLRYSPCSANQTIHRTY